jgi:hypothetical protein
MSAVLFTPAERTHVRRVLALFVCAAGIAGRDRRESERKDAGESPASLAAFRAGRFVRDAALVEVGVWCGVGLAELRRAAAVAGARDRRFSTAGRDAA